MPEWPECEHNRRRIEAGALNRTIEAVELGETSHVEVPSKADRDRLVGRQFTEARRHGKLIFAGSQSGPWIAVHLGMTGSTIAYDVADGPIEYSRVVIVFEGDQRLAFRNPRKLGWLRVIDDPDAFIAEQGMGPDAMEISREAFRDVIGGTRGAIKSALMAQKKLAGVGNLWSDETLYRVGVDPAARADGLENGTLDALYDEMRDVMLAVADTGMDYSRLPEDWLLRVRDDGAACPRCGGRIAKATVGGRSTYYCSDHQSS